MRLLLRWSSAALLLTLLGCSSILPASLPATPTVTPTTETPSEDQVQPTVASAPPTLELWLPPDFDPQGEGPASTLLSERLQAFNAQRPTLSVEVRLKSRSGPGGLLETLRAASTAAPEALPDVVLLEPVGLNTAALKDLIVPLEGILPPPDEEAWYPHSQAAALIDGQFFGYPLASDAIIVAYRPGAFEVPPLAWSTLQESERLFLFPAADPTASFTLAQYESVGGTYLSESGRLALDPTSLAEVLAYYSSLRQAGVLPGDVMEYETEHETWNALLEGRVHSAVSPLSSYLSGRGRQLISAAPLLTRDGEGVSVANTWSWAIVTQDPDRQALAADLILWLHEPEFLGPWSETVGLLPPTFAALEGWQEEGASSAATLLAHSLQARPSEEILATFGPPVQGAVRAVLVEGQSPDSASFGAVQELQNP